LEARFARYSDCPDLPCFIGDHAIVAGQIACGRQVIWQSAFDLHASKHFPPMDKKADRLWRRRLLAAGARSSGNAQSPPIDQRSLLK